MIAFGGEGEALNYFNAYRDKMRQSQEIEI